MKEFSYQCAVCKGSDPQLHHIDGDPTNNDPLNIIPLCANHHLVDQHNPTKAIDPGIVNLLRIYKDPAVLTPQFHALYLRLRFLDAITDDSDGSFLSEQVGELVDFVSCLNMGEFYAKRIRLLTTPLMLAHAYNLGDPDLDRKLEMNKREDDAIMRNALRGARDEVYSLAIQLLRFQDWLKPHRGCRTP